MARKSNFSTFILTSCFVYSAVRLSKSDEILGTNSEDDQLVVDEEQVAEATKLPNSHSAALAMAFIFFCLLAYGVYRLCKYKCGERRQPLTVSLSVRKKDDPGMEGLDDFAKDREAYLAIYGPKGVVA